MSFELTLDSDLELDAEKEEISSITSKEREWTGKSRRTKSGNSVESRKSRRKNSGSAVESIKSGRENSGSAVESIKSGRKNSGSAVESIKSKRSKSITPLDTSQEMYPSAEDILRIEEEEDDVDRMIYSIDKKKRKKSFSLDIDDHPPPFKMKNDDPASNPLLPEKPFVPQRMKRKCGNCGKTMKTKITSENSLASYLFCILLFLTPATLVCGCFAPLCMDSCKNVQHRCSNCQTHLGEYLPK